MKILRIAAIAVLALFAGLVACSLAVYFNQDRIVAAVLSRVRQNTGIEIVPAASHAELSHHLLITFDQPRVLVGGHQVLKLRRLGIAIGYHAILFRRGLPLYAIVADGAAVRLPPKAAWPGNNKAPVQYEQVFGGAAALVRRFSAYARRIEIVDLTLNDASGRPLLRDVQVAAFTRLRARELWLIAFTAQVSSPAISGAHIAGNFRFDPTGRYLHHLLSSGKLWYWNLAIHGIEFGHLIAEAQAEGAVSFTITQAGAVDGDANVHLYDAALESPDFHGPFAIGPFGVSLRFSTSSNQATISEARVHHAGTTYMSAAGEITQPYAGNPEIAFEVAGIKLDWDRIRNRLSNLKNIPDKVASAARALESGQIAIEKVSVQTSMDALAQLNPREFLKQVTVSAMLGKISFSPPAQTGLPRITDLSAEILYSHDRLSAFQGSATIGKSRVNSFSAQLDLGRSLDNIPYSVKAAADADLGELQPAIVKLLKADGFARVSKIKEMRGAVHAELSASGMMKSGASSRFESFRAELSPHGASALILGAPGAVTFLSGKIVATPGTIQLRNLNARATGGFADFNGDLTLGQNGFRTSGMTVDLHRMPIDSWLPLVVDPKELSASGPIGGRLTVTMGQDKSAMVNGKLTLQQGEVQFGFMRSPLIVRPAILTLNNHTMTIVMQQAELEGSPTEWKIAIEDLRHPQIRLDVSAQRLDLEVLKFVRMPWSPATPPITEPYPVSGHIEANQALLGRFAMHQGVADFTYNRGDWHINNLMANSFEGRLALEISGRRPDNWIHIKGSVRNMNAASLFMMKMNTTPMTGHLDVLADLWADTNADFFSTLAGTVTVNVRKGHLSRLKLLSRIWGLIDLRTWLSAKIPDPRVAGISFRTITGNFNATRGRFYTENLYLDGPVMDLIAYGDIDFATSSMKMKVGAIPFGTVSWLLSGVPLIGKNISGGTRSILAAYFNVTGPISDPRVTPAPLTSMAELLKKTIFLPINLIAPDTVR